MILDGKHIAKIHVDTLTKKIQDSTTKPHLVIILIGEDPASTIYTRNKKKLCEKLGGSCTIIKQPSAISEASCLELIKKHNADTNTHGILVQFPLPKHIDVQKVANTIDPSKDVDCFSPINIARLYYGETTGILPATPKGIIHLLDTYNIPLPGANITIV